MEKNLHIFKFIILIFTLLPLSCATFPRSANTLSKLDDKNSIVFGKIELLKNDKVMSAPGLMLMDPIIMSHFSRYTSNASLNKNLWKAGEYAFKVRIFKDGHFAFVIPPGEYYFVELDYLSIFDANPTLGLRTYMGQSPFLMTFNALTNSATYIGTIRHNFYTKWDNWFFLKGTLSIDCTNEFEDAKKWFLKSNQQFETNIVESPLTIRTLSN